VAIGGKGAYVPPSRRGDKPPPGAGAPGGFVGTGPIMSSKEDVSELTGLRVSNLAEDADEDELRALFRQYGHVERFFIARDRETNVSRGFAYLTFSTHGEAERAKAGMNNYPYLHLILKVRARGLAGGHAAVPCARSDCAYTTRHDTSGRARATRAPLSQTWHRRR